MGTLSRLRLRHFRNYTSLDLGLAPGLNLIVGPNGQGKTNLIEAVCYLALLRSFRARRVTALRQWDADYFFVGGELLRGGSTGDGIRELGVGQGERRKLRLDGMPVAKASEFINQFICVTFVPEDIQLLRGAAKLRRRFLDILLSQLHSDYLLHLQRYVLAVRHRNAVLRQLHKYSQTALSAYDELVVRHGSRIALARWQLVHDMVAALEGISPLLYGASEMQLRVKLVSNVVPAQGDDVTLAAVTARYERALAKSATRDCEEGRTCSGPHRDDLRFILGGRDLTMFGSEGECRMACLALRLASLELVRGRDPDERGVVLLVDDVYGDLDTNRRRAFFDMVSGCGQVLLAGTQIPAELGQEADQCLQVSSGDVTAA